MAAGVVVLMAISFASRVQKICFPEPSRRMKSDKLVWHQGSREGRTRSTAAGVHLVGEHKGTAVTLGTRRMGAMR